jgi:hypothetical protein
MNIDNTYDYIVYGSNPAGIVFAIKKIIDGKKVLLLNRYGFLGGSITENFNCLQSTAISHSTEHCTNFLSDLYSERDGFLYTQNNCAVLNPEVVKTQLLRKADSFLPDLLFHVTPVKFSYSGHGVIEIELIAKEGIIKIRTMHLLDATESHSLSRLGNVFKSRLRNRRTNIFISPPEATDFINNKLVSQAIKLDDGRYWISLKNKSNSSAYNCPENVPLEFTNILSSSSARLQLLPSEIYREYKHQDQLEHESDLFFTIEGLLNKNYLPNEQLLRAEDTEKYLNEIK